jgi:hypothetical protein
LIGRLYETRRQEAKNPTDRKPANDGTSCYPLFWDMATVKQTGWLGIAEADDGERAFDKCSLPC